MDIYFRKTSHCSMIVDSEADQENLKKIKIGDVIKAKVTRPRNYEFHKKYMKLLDLGYNNQCQYETFKGFRREVAIKADHFEYHTTLEGYVFKVANSISFASMPQDEFDNLYSRSISIILEHFMKGSTEQEILQILGFD